MKRFNIMIVEDELLIAEMTREMLKNLGYSVVGIAKNYEGAIKLISSSTDLIDLAVLDINFGDNKQDGIELGKHIRDNVGIPFIYLTSYRDTHTVQRAAMTTPDAFLSKPFTSIDLYTTIEMIKARNHKSDHHFIVKDGTESVRLKSSTIRYIKSDNNYIDIVTGQKRYVVRHSLEGFLSELSDANIVRIHRSYAANILHIDAINGKYVHIGKEVCPISRIHKQEVLELFSSG